MTFNITTMLPTKKCIHIQAKKSRSANSDTIKDEKSWLCVLNERPETSKINLQEKSKTWVDSVHAVIGCTHSGRREETRLAPDLCHWHAMRRSNVCMMILGYSVKKKKICDELRLHSHRDIFIFVC